MKTLIQRQLAIFMLVLCTIVCVCQGCVSQTPTPQYANDLAFTVVYTHDDKDKMTSAPIDNAVAAALNTVMTSRNLQINQLMFPGVQNQIGTIRDTERRIQALQVPAYGTQFILLVEISTEFYSPLSGRYRWDVNVNMTLHDLVTHQTMSENHTIPAALMYSHETGDDAIKQVKSEIQREMGSLIDKYMKGRTVSPHQVGMRNAAPPTPAPVPVSQATEAPLGGGASPKSEAIYFILIDRFFNARSDNDFDKDLSDPAGFHGGDLAGVRAKLPYLMEMGITKVWLSPVFTSATKKFFGNAAFHGYWTYDLSTIDRHFGPEEDLRALAEEAKNYGIELVLDLVVNHVGYEHPWLTERPDWFHPDLTIEDWNDVKQLTERNVHGLPDLNQDNPEVYKFLYDAAQKWLSLPNVAGYRLDAVKHVSIDFWAKFNQSLRANHPNMMLLGEYFDGDPKKVDEIQKNGNFTHMFDFPLTFALRDVFCDGRSLAALANIITNDRQYQNPNQMVTFLDNHDMPRFISHCKGRTDEMERALKVMLAWRGIPNLYYGTEYPLEGEKEPDNRGDMKFDHPKFYQLIQNALHLRSEWQVLANGTTGVLEYRPGLVVIGRELRNQQAILIISRSNKNELYHLPTGSWLDVDDHTYHSNRMYVSPNTIRILVRQNASKHILNNEMRTITFHLPDDGYTYAITGSTPEIGQWNPMAGPRTTGKTPITVTFPSQTVVVYKPVRIVNNEVQWSDGDNRELFTEKDGEIDVRW